METTLVINPGSSSKKYALYQNGVEILSMLYERTEEGYAQCVSMNREMTTCDVVSEVQFAHALTEAVERAIAQKAITAKSDIVRVGVRVVAPGTFFTTHRLIDDRYMTMLREVAVFAPLHVPHQIEEIAHAREVLPQARLVGVSDSAFHATMPAYARRYSIPVAEAEAYDVYRFGYHGLSVASVVRQIQQEKGMIPERMVVCHIGSGMSVTALRNGKAVDTTMGYAPTSGLMMGTRAGDVDVATLLYLLDRHNGDYKSIEKMLDSESGLMGMVGSADLRVVLDRVERGDVMAKTALAMYVAGVRKMIGAYSAVLGGIDALVLTATASERNSEVRRLLTEDFVYLGMRIDTEKNEALGARAGIISTRDSVVEVRVVHTDEMGEIARIARVF